MKKSLVLTLIVLAVVSLFAVGCKKEEAVTDTAATDTSMTSGDTAMSDTMATDTGMTTGTDTMAMSLSWASWSPSRARTSSATRPNRRTSWRSTRRSCPARAKRSTP